MTNVETVPELKQIIGAMLFAAKSPLTVSDIRRVMKQTTEFHGGATKDFEKVTEKQIREAMERFAGDLEAANCGLMVSEVANGYRLQNDVACGPWLRQLLDKGRASRLSRPSLETLAIIAYRQPCTRGEIEAVRGVSVDNIVRNLLEMQLIKVTGRSDQPGRPWLFGTTQLFLEHFGIKNLHELPGVEELRRMEIQQEQKRRQKQEVDDEKGAPEEEEPEPVLDTFDDDDDDDDED